MVCGSKVVEVGSTHRVGVTASAEGGAGNQGSSASSGGDSHNVKAGPAPNTRRTSLRVASTQISPNVTYNSIVNMSVALLVDGIKQFAQLGHILGGQLFVFTEVRQQRRELAAEYAVEQAATFVLLPIVALQQR